jgi:hypothetical protein
LFTKFIILFYFIHYLVYGGGLMKTRVDQDRIWPTPCAQRESQKEKKEMKDDHEDGD